MNKLTLCKDLIIDIPPTNANNPETIGELVMNKRQQIEDKYDNYTFHYDCGSNNAEMSAILQLVDDSNSDFRRRNNILDNIFNSIGISANKLGNNKYIVYITLATLKN